MPFVASLAMAAMTAVSPADWAKSFDANALATYLAGPRLDVLVAAAGEPREMARAAADALAPALMRTGKTRVVMNDAALGDLSKASDADIVAAARALPVQLVAVTRVFPTAGQPPTALVVLYDKSGAARATLDVRAGTGLLPSAVAATQQMAKEASLPAAPAPAAIPPPPPLLASDEADLERRRAFEAAQDEYEARYIWFADQAEVQLDTGREVARWTSIFQGKFRVPLEGDAFYEVVGRTDLAERYRTRRAIKLTVLLAGLGTTLTGGGMSFYGMTGRCTKRDSATGSCLKHDSRLATAGGVVAAVGALLMFGSTTFSSHPVDGPEARKIADDFNQRLKRDLGLRVSAPGSSGSPSSASEALPAPAAGLGMEVPF